MKTTSTFSIRLDEKVIVSMVAVSLIALLFTAFRYKNYKPCEAFQFNVYANYFNVGHYIFFKTTDTKNAEQWVWDFGDKSAVDKKSGPLVSHIYREPGQYIISLTINGECKQYQNIVINNVVKDSIRYVFPTVIWPLEPILVGQNIMFQDATNGANRWEWYVGEGKDSKRFTTKDVPFTFQKPGEYVVKLFVNGNIDAKQERTFRVQDAVVVAKAAKVNKPIASRGAPRMNIKDAPDGDPFGPAPKPAEIKPQAPQLTKERFTEMIQGVVEKSVFERDFEPYLCGNRNVRVSLNGDDVSFTKCLSDLRKIKKLKYLKASAYTDPGTNCIQSISIVFKEKKMFGVF